MFEEDYSEEEVDQPSRWSLLYGSKSRNSSNQEEKQLKEFEEKEEEINVLDRYKREMKSKAELQAKEMGDLGRGEDEDVFLWIERVKREVKSFFQQKLKILSLLHLTVPLPSYLFSSIHSLKRWQKKACL